jgi:hypothetical protein
MTARISEADLARLYRGEADYADLVGSSENPPIKARKKRSRGERAVNPYERDIQRAVVTQLRAIVPPDYIVQANVQERQGRQASIFARSQGQVPGWPDIAVWGDGRVWLIELKDRHGVLTKSQKDLHPRLSAAGFPVLPICRSVEEAIDFLIQHGARLRGRVESGNRSGE